MLRSKHLDKNRQCQYKNLLEMHKYFSFNFFVYLILGFLTTDAVAQVQIMGTVVDAEGLPLPAVNVLILNETDSALVKGAVTDKLGIYRIDGIQPGSYILSVSMVGFQTYEESFSIRESEDKSLNIGPITLNESIEQLGEIVTTARRPLYEQEIDRLVVNVQRDITSGGSSALEVLQKSPGVQVNRQSNDIALNGKSGVVILINDKEVRLPLESVITMLNGMSAANIEQIELISTPPAKYDAEGNAGIINIKMKKYSDLGYTGSIGTNAGFNSSETVGGNVSFSRRKHKVAYFFNYSINYNDSEEVMFDERSLESAVFTEVIRSNNLRNPTLNVQNTTLGFEYSLSEKTDAEILVTGYRRRWLTSDLSENSTHSNPDSQVLIEQNINEENLWNNGIINFGVNHTFSNDQSLSFDFDYLYYKNINPSTYRNDLISGDESALAVDAIDVEKETPINIWVSKLDYQSKLSEILTLKAGFKGTRSDFLNDVRVRDTIDGNTVLNAAFTNKADLREFIGAGYFSADVTPSNNITLNAGLRYEFVDRELSSPQEGRLVDSEDGQFFPTLFVNKSFSNENSLNLSYSRRTTRPTFWDLAPFVFFINPRTVISGNSNLKAAISDAVSLAFNKKQFLVSLAYTHSQDAIARWQPSINTETNEQSYSTQNMDYLDTFALTVGLPINPFPWWNIQLNATGNYQAYRTAHLTDNISGGAAGFNAHVNNAFSLPRDYTLDISGFYQSETVWGVSKMKPMGALNMGIQKRLLKGQGTIRLSATDILDTNIWKGINDIESAKINSFFKYHFDARSVKLSLTWNFGSNEFEKIDVSSGSQEEQDRVGIN